MKINKEALVLRALEIQGTIGNGVIPTVEDSARLLRILELVLERLVLSNVIALEGYPHCVKPVSRFVPLFPKAWVDPLARILAYEASALPTSPEALVLMAQAKEAERKLKAMHALPPSRNPIRGQYF